MAAGLLGRLRSRALVGRSLGNSIRDRSSRSDHCPSTPPGTVSVSATPGFHSFASACVDQRIEPDRAHPLHGNVSIRNHLRRLGARFAASPPKKSLRRSALSVRRSTFSSSGSLCYCNKCDNLFLGWF